MHNSYVVQLPDFEGPLDLLLHLVHNKEIDIYQVIIEKITHQYLSYLNTLIDYNLDIGAEFLGICSALMLIKSKMLLPKENIREEEEVPLNYRHEILQHLVKYYEFRELAETLKEQYEKRESCFSRGIESIPVEPVYTPPLEGIQLGEISRHFFTLMEKVSLKKQSPIFEEIFRVQDKIQEYKIALKKEKQLLFSEVFSLDKSKGELIVLFLALLELIKEGIITYKHSNNEVILEDARNAS